ncbi:inhibitor of growth proteins N-terminal histone-binding-domain-containing protein [Syncephalis pseudoplumigaleata]|uniref:Inhibitor of growth proteins N-terminal histone-binding-domain-containing protein n=1 Tax=Syncephalis pseudoplumigaleata TaxID=1712513 RepID=A0A4P9YZ54_9FUNG|nr:inhibitor of growth proteins N-terminal histone-binding-domain-containing protein [Syncephalis pseudoplumigaleata]|eukprot:RKP25396.1 inhibitor of growth proteins N-terminal histone-binding-domain-containing protein [Syncephalis pseudoplumigaleata]
MGPTVNMKYLEDYADTLPLELQRNFSLIRELDAASQLVSFTSRVRELDPERRNDWLRQLLSSFETTVKHGEEKLALATQTYDMVDRHIRRLDDDLQRFEEEQLVSPRIPGSTVSTSMTGGGNVRKRARKEHVAAGGGGGEKGRTTGQSSSRAGAGGAQKQRGSGGRGGASGAGAASSQRGAAIAASRDRAHQL